MSMSLTYDEIKQKIAEGDPDILNGVISGTLFQEQPEQEVSQEPIQQPEIDVQAVETVPVQPVVDPVQEEIERARLYAEMVAKREKEKEEEYLKKLQDRETALKKEQQAKEEMEARLRQLEQMMNNKSTTVQTDQTTTDDDEDEYVSEYAKRTRQKLEELSAKYGESDFKQISDELSRLKQEIEAEKELKRSLLEKEEKEKSQQRLFDSIRQFQLTYPELQTSKNIKELNEEYLKFRKDISYISNASTVKELEKAVADYFNGGDVRKIAEQNGIKPFEDYDKFTKIMDLIDLKEGIKYDPNIGDYVPITDETGTRVRYRSLEEAYKVNNFYDEVNRARKQAYRDVNNKLNQLKSSPVTLGNDQTTTFNANYDAATIKQLINMPVSEWKHDPRKRQMVEKAFRDIGMEPPKV